MVYACVLSAISQVQFYHPVEVIVIFHPIEVKLDDNPTNPHFLIEKPYPKVIPTILSQYIPIIYRLFPFIFLNGMNCWFKVKLLVNPMLSHVFPCYPMNHWCFSHSQLPSTATTWPRCGPWRCARSRRTSRSWRSEPPGVDKNESNTQ